MPKINIDPVLLNRYFNIPRQVNKEFWNEIKINHIRNLSLTGKAVRPWSLPEERSNRILDRIFMKKGERVEGSDTRCLLANGRIELSSPIYFADMSFGSLSGVPNIAIARAADITGILAGTGEGGLHEEVRKSKRIAIQWASARFGVDLSVLDAGMAVVIKVGQGAKIGLGGHLPGVKVTEPISKTRRIPIGTDALSPALHDELEQRIEAMKALTGKPVFVKIGANNTTPLIALEVARMGADGIFIDGYGAGTGAAPVVVRDNVGIPVELVIPSVDVLLREEGLRDGFSVVASGMVSNAEDTAKLMALGADAVALGTALLISLGCIVDRNCHTGSCVTAIASKIEPNPKKLLDLEWATERLVNLVRGWTEELKLIMEEVGVKRLDELVGRRDLLYGVGLNEETLSILGIGGVPAEDKVELDPDVWDRRRVRYLKEMSGLVGKRGGKEVISSMGSVSPPFVERPKRISDWIRCDGAQATRPNIDPYREEIETEFCLPNGLKVLMPIVPKVGRELPSWLKGVFVRVARSFGLLSVVEGDEELVRSDPSMLVSESRVPGLAFYVTEYKAGMEEGFEEEAKPLLIGLGSDERSIGLAPRLLKHSDGLIIDEDVSYGNPLPLEIAVSEIDRSLRREGIRSAKLLIAQSGTVRGVDDAYKLIGLGADLVSFDKAFLISIGYYDSLDEGKAEERLKNTLLSMWEEMRLLAAAAGVTNLQSTLVGNRELFRTVDLAPSVRKRLYLKPGGSP